MTSLTLSADPRIARRQLALAGRHGFRPASRTFPEPGRTIRMQPVPTAPAQRRSHPNRPGGPRYTPEMRSTRPRSFRDSLLLLSKMMEVN